MKKILLAVVLIVAAAVLMWHYANPDANIAVRVTEMGSGEPVEGAEVILYRYPDGDEYQERGEKIRTGVTDAAGSIRFVDLLPPDGAHTVFVNKFAATGDSADNYNSERADLELRRGENVVEIAVGQPSYVSYLEGDWSRVAWVSTSTRASFTAAFPDSFDRLRVVEASAAYLCENSSPDLGDLQLEFEGARRQPSTGIEWVKFAVVPAAEGDEAQLYLARAGDTLWEGRALGTAFPGLYESDPAFFGNF